MTLPLSMNGRLSECVLMTYRTPAHGVRHLVPAGLELETVGGWAFWNVVACCVEGMRPTGVPKKLGVTYHHVAYRLHVRGKTAAGEALRGLYFVRSDADSRLVGSFGNLLTHFRLHTADVELSRAKGDGGDVLTVAVMHRREGADALARIATDGGAEAACGFAPDSPFHSADEKEQFLKYCPLGLAVDLDGRYLEMAEVTRDESAWRERPVKVIEAHWRFLENLGQRDLRLERATRVAAIDYRWRLGRRELIAPMPAVVPAHPHRKPAARAAA